MWIIVGLGNQGIRYKWSRHNIGFQALDLVADRYKIKFRKNKNKIRLALIGKGMIGDEEVILVKPLTFMNRSGLAVKRIHKLYRVPLEKILVVLDDVDLPWDKLRIRAQGSSGGHKGLQSIIDELGEAGFPRLRMGIGRAKEGKADVVHHVLEKFNREERDQLKEYCSKALSAIITLLDKDIETAMNRFN